MGKKKAMEAASLTDISANVVISNLGTVAKSGECCFSCGGAVPQVESIRLVYKNQAGDWKLLQLPAEISDEQLQVFLDSCSTASFGIASEVLKAVKISETRTIFVDVEEPSTVNHRCALKLEPDCFYTHFELASTSALDHISKVMCNGSPIRAELRGLKVYSAGGGHAMSYLDAPISEEMFGSLVVCLPSRFTGGALVLQHRGRPVRFDWSCSTGTNWAAFFSDVVHEILLVTSGCQIALTYNLYHSSPINPASFAGNPLYQELSAALRTPHFMRGGGTLGFFCQHQYTNISTDLGTFYPFLKGDDAMVYYSARALGLSIALKPMLCLDKYYNRRKQCKKLCTGMRRYGDPIPEAEGNFVIPRFEPLRVDYLGYSDGYSSHTKYGLLKDAYHLEQLTPGVVSWCQQPEYSHPFLATTYYECDIYGDDHEPRVFYQAPAFLLEVPKFTSRRGSPASADLPPSKRVRVDESGQPHTA